jgi:hypothetical protein
LEEMGMLHGIEAEEAVKSLGVMLNLEGTDKAEATYLSSNADMWAEHIQTGLSTKTDAWYALNTAILKMRENRIM